MARIADFLDSLAEDPDLEGRFDGDPEGVMIEAGLAEDQQRLILDASTEELRNAIRDELHPDVMVFMIKMRSAPYQA